MSAVYKLRNINHRRMIGILSKKLVEEGYEVRVRDIQNGTQIKVAPKKGVKASNINVYESGKCLVQGEKEIGNYFLEKIKKIDELYGKPIDLSIRLTYEVKESMGETEDVVSLLRKASAILEERVKAYLHLERVGDFDQVRVRIDDHLTTFFEDMSPSSLNLNKTTIDNLKKGLAHLVAGSYKFIRNVVQHGDSQLTAFHINDSGMKLLILLDFLLDLLEQVESWKSRDQE